MFEFEIKVEVKILIRFVRKERKQQIFQIKFRTLALREKRSLF